MKRNFLFIIRIFIRPNRQIMWKTFYGSSILEPINEAVEIKLKELLATGYPIKVCIGTDSMVYGNDVQFATAIVFVIIGNGGCMFINKHKEKRKIALKERMLMEIGFSVETAFALEPVLKKLNVPMEVHADINKDPRYPSNASLKEAMGYIQSMGYSFVAKPDAFASSVCADRFTN